MVIASTNVRHTGAVAADLLSASIQVSTDAASVGDTLVAVLFVADLSVTSGDAAQGVTVPSGWMIRKVASMVPTGDPRRMSGAFIVAEKRVTAAGTDDGVFKWSCVQWRPMKLYKTWCQLTNLSLLSTHMQHTASLTVLRFTGVTGILSIIETRLANQVMTYPGQQLPYTAAGHAITLGGIKQAKQAGTLLPSQFHTERAKFGPLRYGGLDIPQTGVSTISIATRDFTNATALSDFSGTAVGDGVAETILVAQVVKPQVSWVTPTPGVVDLTRPLPVSWTPPNTGEQSYYALYRESPPGSSLNIQWWSGSAWQPSGVWVSSPVTSATLAGFAATSGTVYRFLLKTHSTLAPDDSDYALLDLTHRPTPAAPTITLSPAPSGGVVASRVPTMTVSGETVTDGGSVLGRELQWTDATGAILAVSNASPWALTTPLTNGTVVKARARFLQGGGMWSDWAETTVTVTVPKPAAPATTFQTVMHPVSGLPMPQLTVTAAAGLTVRVERGGVVIGEVVSAGPSVKVVDLAAPSGPVTWTVTTLAATLYAERSQTTTVTGTVTSEGGWLFDPTRPETAVLPGVREMGEVSRDLRSSVFDPIGETYSLVQPGVPAAGRGSVTFYHGDPAVIDRTRVLLESGAPLVLRGWAERGEVGSWHPDLHFEPVGDTQVSRLAQGPFGYRILSVGYIEAPPIVAGLATLT